MTARIKKLYARLEKKNLNGLILSSPQNITYLTEFYSRDAYLLVSKQGNVYFTDSRYTQEAKVGLKAVADIEKINGSVFKLIANACREFNLKRVGFEERNLSLAEYKKIKENLKEKINLIPTHSLVEEMRQIKSQAELEKIKKAIQITIKALRFIKDFISPGKREIEVAGELERFIRYQGARTSAFEIIVASGPNSSFPHHITSRRILKENEPVLVDIGVDYQGYKSDLTRVFFLGRISVLYKNIYDIVFKAQTLAIKAIKPNIPAYEIDAVSRNYITQKGYGKFFSHALGHGIGLEVHEAVHISAKENNPLKSGMVFTVEPAIYLPNEFGIRLEDMVLVTKEGCEVLSGALHK